MTWDNIEIKQIFLKTLCKEGVKVMKTEGG